MQMHQATKPSQTACKVKTVQVVQHLRQLLMKSKGPAMTLPTHQASKNIQRG